MKLFTLQIEANNIKYQSILQIVNVYADQQKQNNSTAFANGVYTST